MPVDLGALEREINDDKKVRDEFMADPITLLERRGLVLSPAMQDNLKRYLEDVKNPAKPASGASTAEGGISISIGKSF